MISSVVSLLELNSYMHVMTFIRLQLTGCQMSGFTVKLIIVITHPFMSAIGVIVLLPLRRYHMCAEKQAI